MGVYCNVLNVLTTRSCYLLTNDINAQIVAAFCLLRKFFRYSKSFLTRDGARRLERIRGEICKFSLGRSAIDNGHSPHLWGRCWRGGGGGVGEGSKRQFLFCNKILPNFCLIYNRLQQ